MRLVACPSRFERCVTSPPPAVSLRACYLLTAVNLPERITREVDACSLDGADGSEDRRSGAFTGAALVVAAKSAGHGEPDHPIQDDQVMRAPSSQTAIEATMR